MGGCTSKRAAAVKAQQQSSSKSAGSAKPSKKKKKKSKSKIYSAFASMESLSNEIPADRACNLPQPRKTPYTRVANAASMQLTAFGFRRRATPDMASAPAAPTSSYHCSPNHVPPTPPLEQKPKNPVANRFGFQLSPRATAVLNNINAQIVSNNSTDHIDGNCNPVSAPAQTTNNYEPPPLLEENNRSTLAVTATNPPPTLQTNIKPQTSLLPKPKSKEHKSRLPGPKPTSSKSKAQSGLKQPAAGKKNGASIAKPVVVKPVSRPQNTKSAKTEANIMVANQSSDSSPGSGKSASSGIGTLSVTDDSPTDLRVERYELRAPTAISEDLDEEEREEKACIDENSSEKLPPAFPIPVWTETATDEVSSSGSYSEGIEEQQIEFPDNVTDKSGDSLISSISSTSSELNGKKKKKKSGSSLSQLSNGSDDNFLIDDEIADQPGLTFDDNNYDDSEYIVDDEADGEEAEEAEEGEGEETEAHYNKDDTTFMGEITLNGEDQTYNIEESVTNEETPPQDLSTLVQDAPPSIQVGCEEGGREARASPVRTVNSTPRRMRSNSTGTLSPCESITSDDLMLDFEESVASRNVSMSQLAELGCGGISGSEEIINKWNVMLGSVTSLNSLGCGGQPVVHQQTPPSLRSRASSNSEVGRGQSYNSPLRPPRSSVSSIDGDWLANQNILQDIRTLKTDLLKLKRTLQDADVRNPFDSSLSISGLYYNLANSDGFEKEDHASLNSEEENVDLRRQVVFLKQQLSEKDRTISLLQQQMTKYCGIEGSPENAAEKANIATQTERIRPVSMGSTMAHSVPADGSGPLVSTSTENLKQHMLDLDGPELQKPILALNNNIHSKGTSKETLLTSSNSIPIPQQRKVNS